MEGLKVSEADLSIFVHPSKSMDVTDAIRRQLSSLLFKYDEIFDGVVLAYAVVDLVNQHAKILPGLFPCLDVSLKASFLLFAPKKGMLAEGKVVKLSRESVHVVVLGFSAAVIYAENIREEFKFKKKRGRAQLRSRSNKHHAIKVGTMIRFRIESFDEEVLHMVGSLQPTNTGSLYWLEETSKPDRSAKRVAEMEDGGDVIDGGAISVDSELAQKFKRHKSR